MLAFSPEQIFAFALAGTAVSLLLEFFPKLNAWFNALPDNKQRYVVLASGLVVVLGSWGLDCLNLFAMPWVCSSVGLLDVVASFFVFVFASQGTYLVTPKKASNA